MLKVFVCAAMGCFSCSTGLDFLYVFWPVLQTCCKDRYDIMDLAAKDHMTLAPLLGTPNQTLEANPKPSGF